jgi:hypothetical protein
MLRHVLSVLSVLSLLHFGLVGRDLVCPDHDSDRKATTTHGNTSEAGSGAHAGHDSKEESPCRTPGLPACCQLIASCSITMSRGAEVDAPHVALGNAHIGMIAAIMPRSTTFGPEPPPPKA